MARREPISFFPSVHPFRIPYYIACSFILILYLPHQTDISKVLNSIFFCDFFINRQYLLDIVSQFKLITTLEFKNLNF